MPLKLRPAELKPGMILVNHLSHQGKIIFKAGTLLDAASIKKIMEMASGEHWITIELPKHGEVVRDQNGKINSNATFTNIVMDLRNKFKKK